MALNLAVLDDENHVGEHPAAIEQPGGSAGAACPWPMRRRRVQAAWRARSQRLRHLARLRGSGSRPVALAAALMASQAGHRQQHVALAVGPSAGSGSRARRRPGRPARRRPAGARRGLGAGRMPARAGCTFGPQSASAGNAGEARTQRGQWPRAGNSARCCRPAAGTPAVSADLERDLLGHAEARRRGPARRPRARRPGRAPGRPVRGGGLRKPGGRPRQRVGQRGVGGANRPPGPDRPAWRPARSWWRHRSSGRRPARCRARPRPTASRARW